MACGLGTGVWICFVKLVGQVNRRRLELVGANCGGGEIRTPLIAATGRRSPKGGSLNRFKRFCIKMFELYLLAGSGGFSCVS